MDNICHTLAGAAFGEAGLKRRTRFGDATLMIASNLPDLDVLVFVTSTPAVAFRRGWTHGVAAQLLLPVALTLVMLLAARRRPATGDAARAHVGWLLALSYLGVMSHVLLDLLNNYGIRLLVPLDWRWFYGDAVFIIDPWLWLALGTGVWIARRRTRPEAARAGVIVSAVYVAAMCVSAAAARAAVIDQWTSRTGGPPHALMVGPVPITPLTRAVIVDAGDRYYTGTFVWADRAARFVPEALPKNDHDARVAVAREAPNIRAFLAWARFPYWFFEETAAGTRVSVGDVRFGSQVGFRESVMLPRVAPP